MNDSKYVIILCGEFDDSYNPLTRTVFWELYHQYHDSIDELIHSDDERIRELLKRSGSVSFAVDELNQKGFHITTFLDDDFPKRLLAKLNDGKNDFCPPLLYTCGNSSLNRNKSIGYVGARSIKEEDIRWTEERVKNNLKEGYGIVTGGAKGIDETAMKCAIDNGGFAVVFLPDNLKEKAHDPYYQKNLLNGCLLLYSHTSPAARKTKNSFVASAMERNKFIYAQSVATVVVHTDLEKGGTWAGAKEALRHGWTSVFTWDNKNYPGNQKLIHMDHRNYRNAKALSDTGKRIPSTVPDEPNDPIQTSLFELIPSAA